MQVGALVAAGQLLLLLLGPYTRAARAAEGAAGPLGVALLSSDSLYYLGLARAADLLGDAPLTRIALPLLLRLGDAMGSAEGFIVLVNLLALIGAGLGLYDLGLRHGGTPRAGLLAAATFVVNPLTAQWMRFVLTETLGYTSVVIALWGMVRFLGSARAEGAVTALLAGGFVTLLRPNGVLVLGAALTIVLGRRLVTSRRWLAAAITVATVWAGVAAVFLIGSREPGRGDERTSQMVVSRIHAGVVVEGLPHVLVTTPMPTASDPSDLSLAAAGRYALEHPVAVAGLGVRRILVETAQVRRHYPDVVNILMGLGFAVFMASAFLGALASHARPLRVSIIALMVPQILLIGATFAVPEARYGWLYLVALCPWAGIGADAFLRTSSPRSAASARASRVRPS